MQTFTVEVAIPDELKNRFESRLEMHGGDAARYIQEVIVKDLFLMSEMNRQALIDDAFEKIDKKYGEALRNLAK